MRSGWAADRMRQRVGPELIDVAETAFRLACQELKSSQQVEARIAMQIARVRDDRATRIKDEDLASLARLPLWMAWCDRRLGELHRELASEKVVRETTLARVRHSYGRLTALREIAESDARQAAVRKRRRDKRNLA